MNTRLKSIRSELNLSQAKFAEEMHVTRDVIANYESGRVVPTDLFLSTLCNKYNIGESWLRTGIGEMHPAQTREAEIAEMTSKMFKAGDADKRYQLYRLFNQLDDDQLDVFFDAAKEWVDVVEKAIALENEKELEEPELEL